MLQLSFGSTIDGDKEFNFSSHLVSVISTDCGSKDKDSFVSLFKLHEFGLNDNELFELVGDGLGEFSIDDDDVVIIAELVDLLQFRIRFNCDFLFSIKLFAFESSISDYLFILLYFKAKFILNKINK